MTSTSTPTNHNPNGPSSSSETAFLSAAEVARRLRVCKTALYGWLAQGLIAHHRVGKLIRIREADMHAFLARNRVEPKTIPAYDSHS